jgi:hypothetical protein
MCALALLGAVWSLAHAETSTDWGLNTVLDQKSKLKRDERISTAERTTSAESVPIWAEPGYWAFAGTPPKQEQGKWQFANEQVKNLEDFASPAALAKQNLSTGTVLFLGDSTQREVVHAFCVMHKARLYYASEEIQAAPWLQRQGDWWCRMPGGLVFVFMMLYGVDGFKKSEFHDFDSWLLEQASYTCEYCFKTDIRIKSTLPRKLYPRFKSGERGLHLPFTTLRVFPCSPPTDTLPSRQDPSKCR